MERIVTIDKIPSRSSWAPPLCWSADKLELIKHTYLFRNRECSLYSNIQTERRVPLAQKQAEDKAQGAKSESTHSISSETDSRDIYTLNCNDDKMGALDTASSNICAKGVQATQCLDNCLDMTAGRFRIGHAVHA